MEVVGEDWLEQKEQLQVQLKVIMRSTEEKPARLIHFKKGGIHDYGISPTLLPKQGTWGCAQDPPKGLDNKHQWPAGQAIDV